MALYESLKPNYAWAQQVPKDDARIRTEYATVQSPQGNGSIKGYLARPAAAGKYPAVLVVHENRGLNPHIKDVARRMALEGFMALAPDFLTPAGGTPEDEDKAREMIGALDRAQTTANAVATVSYLKNRDDSNGKVGIIGFCWGGGLVNQTAVHAGDDLAAAVAYYGQQPDANDVSQIKAKLLLHYAGLDDRIDAGIPAYEAALKAAGVDYQIFVYEGVNHAFNNDTSEARYNKPAADLAWSRTVEFLKGALG